MISKMKVPEQEPIENILQMPQQCKKKLRGFSPQANYTDRATAACRRS
jgi:hypothetical protein